MELLEEITQSLQREFELSVQKDHIDEKQLTEVLSKAISRLLDRDFERLLQICYRIDIGEKDLKRILNESKPENISRDLAQAFIARQRKKIEIRRKYSSL
ncbi:hypothetical protein A33Q_4434 [Indibacter alkaliphilus LW1]|jgi:hypothetical protein|uniref:Uncharacterized protein n=1 Tax=Indibacter alkaliphilus (strain CCUG 57479 / KCTC 22604 / LW1) TaxID=1189612 RepID=S2DK14_INDAL|nr:hypothetical protein [Indibacter alkaliphilus]EOZ92341.1 hypothetical protein A33Q_4434 [Indibacter alkaliphilus LW1]